MSRLADAAHAYHTLKRHGVPEENMIVMMYDDIANNPQNPYKGKLFNRPHGEDVYQGLKIDYNVGFLLPVRIHALQNFLRTAWKLRDFSSH
ncbi:unnamed protein product [Nippostrongylus brasiliensis]|uniref:Legumain (inferred by orthology to a human protein) n=1 Tax=Nippostrongylus brasiliensis TaxID=27835 RepID=A0A0N4XZJ6_NIPBR|nr:unnamed protein product [Nippostrongylus brasiliensis]